MKTLRPYNMLSSHDVKYDGLANKLSYTHIDHDPTINYIDPIWAK